MTPDLAMIYLFASNFAPSGYSYCNGALLAISSNTALFSLIGTYYGGNGTSNFALPELSGRVPIGIGQSTGTSLYALGQSAGAETVNILTSNLPAHTHALNVNTAAGNTGVPGVTTYLAAGPSTGSGPNASQLETYTNTSYNSTLAPTAIGMTGSNTPISIVQPYLAISYVIALQGVFPSRN